MDIKEIFTEIENKRGTLANIHREFSAFPIGVKAHFDFYDAIMLGEDLPLNREDREWLAVETSIVNECSYCFRHHKTALDLAKSKMKNSSPTEKQQLLSLLAQTLTKKAWKSPSLHSDFIEAGFSEAQWQHAVMVVSYFNLANRCAHAMDLELEADFEKSCN